MMSWNKCFFHSPSSSLMEVVISMHDFVMLFLISVLIVVSLVMIFSLNMKSFSQNFSENHQLETVWTILPFLILLFIVIPSLNSIYMLDSCFFCGISLMIVGHQWYWSYFLNDLKDCFFDSYMDPGSSLRLVDVDNRVILPYMIPIRFMTTSADVIHSWTLPSFGVKMDAVPGRLNQFCFSSKRPGVFFGQCSEICGANHSFMPIVVEFVDVKDFISMIDDF